MLPDFLVYYEVILTVGRSDSDFPEIGKERNLRIGGGRGQRRENRENRNVVVHASAGRSSLLRRVESRSKSRW